MIREWTYEEVSQLYSELATINSEDHINMWQPIDLRNRLYLKMPLYTNLDLKIMEKHSCCIMIGTEDNKAVALLWAKEEEGDINI